MQCGSCQLKLELDTKSEYTLVENLRKNYPCTPSFEVIFLGGGGKNSASYNAKETPILLDGALPTLQRGVPFKFEQLE